MKLQDIQPINEGKDKVLIAAGAKAVAAFHKALEAEDIRAFTELYGALANGMPDGGFDKILHDPATGDFYMEFTWVISFDEEEGEDDAEDTAFTKFSKGKLTEIDKMPTDSSFVDVTKLETDFNS